VGEYGIKKREASFLTTAIALHIALVRYFIQKERGYSNEKNENFKNNTVSANNYYDIGRSVSSKQDLFLIA